MKENGSQKYEFDTPVGKLTLRPIEERDVEAQMVYLYESSFDFLSEIGFDLTKFPPREILTKDISEAVRLDRAQGNFRSVVAELNSTTVAAIHLHLRNAPDISRGHFHIFNSDLRGKGLGAQILGGGLRLLLKQHALTKIYIEPKKSNVPMNRLLSKMGFKLLGETTFASPMTAQFTALRYEVTPEALR